MEKLFVSVVARSTLLLSYDVPLLRVLNRSIGNNNNIVVVEALFPSGSSPDVTLALRVATKLRNGV